MSRKSLLAIVVVVLTLSSSAWAQGVLIVVDHPHPAPLPRPFPRPRPPEVSYRIKELAVHAKVSDQVARVQVTQSFVNTGSRPIEASFVFPLPYDGAVDRLTFLVDGREYEAKLLPASEARGIYEGYVRRNQDPALLEWVGVGMFRTSVFPIPPGAERRVTLRYNQLLRRQGSLVDFLLPLSTAKYTAEPIEKLSLQVAIDSPENIKSIYSPSLPLNIQRPDARHAVASFTAQHVIPSADLRLFYDVHAGTLNASVVSYRPDKSDDGYFLMLASPDLHVGRDQLTNKTVLLVVDRSGSMSGPKIEQAKDALRFVLNNLREGDLFNIVAYDSEVESFRPELQRYSDATRQDALGFVAGIHPGGSTNIDQALTASLAMLADDQRPQFVLFLTDGLPTVGETNEAQIVAHARQHNRVRARLMTFGVGYDVNSRLLDRLVYENHGVGEYVRPDEDLEQHVATFYNRISAPVMSDVAVEFAFPGLRLEDGAAVNRLYPRTVRDLFAGEQLVLVGRYRQGGDGQVIIRGRLAAGETSFNFPAQFSQFSSDQSHGFVEKLWAMRRIGEIIDELDLHGKNEELVQELVRLSTQHGILTPYTSFLADENRPAPLADAAANYRATGERLEQLNLVEGASAFRQRQIKQLFKGAGGTTAPADSFGFGGASVAGPTAPASSAAPAPVGPGFGVAVPDLEAGVTRVAAAVRQVGNVTLYKQGHTWIAANAHDIDLNKQQGELQIVRRFSDEYFRLTAANTAAENAVLAAQSADEELLIRLRGKAYLIQ